jgi:multidrug efflux system outer membrane protein
MKLRSLSMALLLAGLQGCSLIPAYHTPAMPVAETWPKGPAYPTPQAQKAHVPHWQGFFKDPALQRLIEQALTNNQDLRQAALNVEAYRAQYRIQRSNVMPDIDLSGSNSRQRLPADLRTSDNAGVDSESQLNVGITSYELDIFGRIRSLQSSALQTYLATAEAQNGVRIALISDVATAYMTWLADRTLLQVTQETLQSYEKSLSLIDASSHEGISSALDVRQARTLVEGARAQQYEYTRQVAQDANALELLLGGSLPADLRFVALDADYLAQIPTGLPSDLLIRRPDIREAEHRLLAANADIGAARAAFFPSISLTASAGTASDSLGGLFKGGSGTWNFVPQISVPIFNGGRLEASLDYAEIQRDIQVSNYQKSIQVAFREVSDGLAARGTYGGQLQAQSALVQADQEYFDMAQQRYDEGVDSYLTLLDAQRELFAARQKLLSDRLAQLSAQVQLYKALGGGWQTFMAVGGDGQPQG